MEIEKYYKSVGVDIKLDPNMKVPCSVRFIAKAFLMTMQFQIVIDNLYESFLLSTCVVMLQIIHGKESCVKHGITFFIEAYKRALPVYIPVYLIPALIVHRQDLLKK